jgi:hypothetical protein
MQRGFSADCTTPSSVCLIASAGHTSAQVGSSQCMHTIGAVWVLAARSSVLEVDQRLAPVGAALLARLNARLAADAAALVDDEHRLVVDAKRSSACLLLEGGPDVADLGRGVALGLLDALPRDLELGHLRDRVDGRLVSWLAALLPGQWYGMNTVSGRMVVTTGPAG